MARTLVAGRVSLSIGLLAGLVAVTIGVLYGAISGFIGGKTDDVMMRIVDTLYALPSTFFVIMLVVFFGRNFILMFFAVGCVMWLDMARIVRGQALSIKRQICASSRSFGCGQMGHCVAPHHSQFAGACGDLYDFAGAASNHSGKFSVLSWPRRARTHVQLGVLISQGARNIPYANWLLFFPSFFLTSTLFALNFIGDGLHDALDPKNR